MKRFMLPVLTILFFLSGLFFLWDGSQTKGVIPTVRTVEGNLDEAVKQMEASLEGAMSRFVEGDFSKIDDPNVGVYLYENLDLINWSDKSFVPASSQVNESFQIKLLQVG